MRRTDSTIPNIDFGRVFDLRYEDSDVHYESLGPLADFFGRDMPAHRHDRVYQLHFLSVGHVRLWLDQSYAYVQAPAFFLTPPAFPHAFVFSDDCAGHVLTVKQDVLWRAFEGELQQSQMDIPAFIAFDASPHDGQHSIDAIETLFGLTAAQWRRPDDGRERNLQAFARLIFSEVFHLTAGVQIVRGAGAADQALFRRFTSLIETSYTEHWPLKRYAAMLGVTESRLNDLCRRVANVSSKRLLIDRQVQEARRMLCYTGVSIAQIAFDLGFKDASYFTRFFRRESGIGPSDFRVRGIPAAQQRGDVASTAIAVDAATTANASIAQAVRRERPR